MIRYMEDVTTATEEQLRQWAKQIRQERMRRRGQLITCQQLSACCCSEGCAVLFYSMQSCRIPGQLRWLFDGALEHPATRRYGTLSHFAIQAGKAAASGLFADLIGELDITDACYVEPYAGGAGAEGFVTARTRKASRNQ